MNQANWLRCLKLIEDLFIYDTKEDESDVGVGYAAKTNDDDGLLNIVIEDCIVKSLSAWSVKICSLQDETSSVHLAFNGLSIAQG